MRVNLIVIAAGISLPVLVCGQTTERGDPAIKLLCANPVRPAMERLIPEYEKQTGRHVSMQTAIAAAIQKDVSNGARVDVVILPRNFMDDLESQLRVKAGPQ